MLPPLPRCSRWGPPRSNLPHPYQPSPIPLSGRPAHRPFRGLLGVHSRCSLHTRAVTRFVTAIRRLQTFRLLHACSGCFRLERIAGWALHPLESAALSRRTPASDIRLADSASETGPCRGGFGDIGSAKASRVGATPNANLPI